MTAERIGRRVIIIVAGPIIVPVAFVIALIREFGRGLRYAYLEAASEVEAMRRGWK